MTTCPFNSTAQSCVAHPALLLSTYFSGLYLNKFFVLFCTSALGHHTDFFSTYQLHTHTHKQTNKQTMLLDLELLS